MKKLLVLVMVLAMASLASAALTLTISGPSSLAYNAVGLYTVSYSDASLAGSDTDITSTAGTIGGGVILATNRTTSYDYTGANTTPPNNYEVTMFNETWGLLQSPLFSFTLTAPSSGTSATIAVLENSFYGTNQGVVSGGTMPSMQVTFIPEPITIALLGLGGLFLRRRMA